MAGSAADLGLAVIVAFALRRACPEPAELGREPLGECVRKGSRDISASGSCPSTVPVLLDNPIAAANPDDTPSPLLTASSAALKPASSGELLLLRGPTCVPSMPNFVSGETDLEGELD